MRRRVKPHKAKSAPDFDRLARNPEIVAEAVRFANAVFPCDPPYTHTAASLLGLSPSMRNWALKGAVQHFEQMKQNPLYRRNYLDRRAAGLL